MEFGIKRELKKKKNLGLISFYGIKEIPESVMFVQDRTNALPKAFADKHEGLKLIQGYCIIPKFCQYKLGNISKKKHIGGKEPGCT